MSTNPDDLGKQATFLQSTANDLLKRYELLATFSEAAQWDSDALALIKLFEKYCAILHHFRYQTEQSLKDAKAERDALPFHRKIFSSRSQEKIHQTKIEDFDKHISNLEKAIGDLHQLIDSTPSSKAEQKEMLRNLSITKKEITLEKRKVNEEMRQLRTQARQGMATWTGVSRGFMGDVARYKRATIRREKENNLSPLEAERNSIEAQLMNIERQINWVSRFQGENPQEETEVIRCAYCGRRVLPPSVCPGCGSDQTIRDN